MVNDTMKITICVPTWEQYGDGVYFLKCLLESIRSQNFKNFNVVISDHSLNDEIEELIRYYNNDFEIKFFKNFKNRGNGPANTNNAIINADGDIIKIMFQDDLFVNNDALRIIHDTFLNSNSKWVVNGCNHTNDGINFYKEMVPSWNENILYGVNSISSPSVLSFINDDINYFDENLVMLMDCEYYYQLYKKYGLPTIVKTILISNRTHPNQISSKYNKNINEEISYVKKKYNGNF